MPFNVSVSSRARRPVQAMASGGYQIADMPDPNDPVQRFAVMQTGNINPTVTAGGGSALAQNVALAQRGAASRQLTEQQDRQAQPFRPMNFVNPSIGVDALLQALFEQGATHLQTGAASQELGGVSSVSAPGMSAKGGLTEHALTSQPGFFDTQQRRMPFARSASESMLLNELMKNPNYNPTKTGRR